MQLTNEQIQKALDDLERLFADKTPFFQVAHYLQARFLESHKETLAQAAAECLKMREERRELVESVSKTRKGLWYVIGQPWNNQLPYICAGHYDPHAGEAIIDMLDKDIFQETDDMTLEEVEQEWMCQQQANADFIALAANTVKGWCEDERRLNECIDSWNIRNKL